MLYNNDLIKKLRIAAAILSSFFAGYALLVYNDSLIDPTQLLVILSCLVASLLGLAFLSKPKALNFSFYAINMIVVMAMLLFRHRGNFILDVTFLLVTIPVLILFVLEVRKGKASNFAQ